MSTFVINSNNVHVGHWINWTYGSIRGSTITLSRRDGALLTAFTAIFISYAGARAWIIISFALHLWRSEEGPRDAIYHQRQLLLRNESSGESAAWAFFTMLLAWRKVVGFRTVASRLFPFIILSLVTSLAFAVAGVFSAQISSAMGNEVLLRAPNCGLPFQNATSDQADQSNIYWPYVSGRNKMALDRADQCYSSNGTSDACPTYVRSRLPLTITTNASCPFNDRICRTQSENLFLDTGFLNSHYDFGINTPPEDRFLYRQTFHCAPLVSEGYSEISSSWFQMDGSITENFDGRDTFKLYFGGYNGMAARNLTYQYPTVPKQILPVSSDGRDYTLMSMRANANNSNVIPADFESIDDLMRPDADTVLLFLSGNAVEFTALVDDLWYSAHTPFKYFESDRNFSTGRVMTYVSDYAVNALGCVPQFQFCNPNLPPEIGCVPIIGGEELSSDDMSIFKNERQANLFNLFMTILFLAPTSIASSLLGIGSAILKSRNSLALGVQAALPNNQWQIEVESWVSTMLAGQQRIVIDYAMGGDSSLPAEFLMRPNGSYDEFFCNSIVSSIVSRISNSAKILQTWLIHSKKILSSDFASFSNVGLVLTFTLGGLLIIISFYLEPLLIWSLKKWEWDNYSMHEWSMNDKFNLQSSLHETLGAGTWKREVDSVPTTLRGERLAVLDVYSNPSQPRWKPPPLSWDIEMLPLICVTGGENTSHRATLSDGQNSTHSTTATRESAYKDVERRSQTSTTYTGVSAKDESSTSRADFLTHSGQMGCACPACT